MILGVGTDIASIERIAETLERHEDRFVEMCFSATERDRVEDSARGDKMARAAGYAKRWAAKEACAKALGLGIRDDIYLKDIIVSNNAAGLPSLTLGGGAKERLTVLTPQGMTAKAHVSLTDDNLMAMAFVVLSAEAIK